MLLVGLILSVCCLWLACREDEGEGSFLWDWLISQLLLLQLLLPSAACFVFNQMRANDCVPPQQDCGLWRVFVGLLDGKQVRVLNTTLKWQFSTLFSPSIPWIWFLDELRSYWLSRLSDALTNKWPSMTSSWINLFHEKSNRFLMWNARIVSLAFPITTPFCVFTVF